MDNLGDKLKNLRIKKEMSQLEVANILHVSNKTISSWENNRTIPDINFIFKLCDIFHTSFYSLTNGEYCNLNNTELEVKIKVDLNDWKRILNFVKKRDSYIGKSKQLDTYFSPQIKDFKNEWLRIRNENSKYILNYKKLVDKNYCDEYETIIDNEKKLENILFCLNFKKIGVIDKVREKYLYNEKYEFSFDNVKDIGLFIEIEVKSKVSDYEKEYNDLINFLNKLKIDLNMIDNKRYFNYLVRSNKNETK